MTEDLKQGSKLGNYELILRVGRGGMATVWVARERAATTKDDRLVAVKVMLTELADENEFIKMYLDEVDRKSTRLNSSHANISYAVFCLKKKRIEKPQRQD